VVSRVSAGSAGRPMVNPNWPAFCADGTLLVSDSGTWEQDDGCVFAITPDGHTSVLTTACPAFPNGMALSADGAWLHVAETHAQRVVRVGLQGPGRGLVEPVCELPARSLPDGLAVDAQGGLLIACYTPDVIYRWHDGHLSVLAEDWTRHILASPTNVAFCGPDLGTLVVASLARWHLCRLDVEVPGVPLPYPNVSPREEPV
jgi:gluconolactonase